VLVGGGILSRLKRLIQEIHRRSLWQVLGIYLGGAWVALQGIEALVSVLGLPEWVPGFALVLLIVGLPIELAIAEESRIGDPSNVQKMGQSLVL
jgi:hypothetical protein